MSSALQINLKGIEDMFLRSGRQVCADCGFDFECPESSPPTARKQEQDEDDESTPVPLLLFKGEGEDTLMLTLCWPCASVRMQNAGGN